MAPPSGESNVGAINANPSPVPIPIAFGSNLYIFSLGRHHALGFLKYYDCVDNCVDYFWKCEYKNVVQYNPLLTDKFAQSQ